MLTVEQYVNQLTLTLSHMSSSSPLYWMQQLFNFDVTSRYNASLYFLSLSGKKNHMRASASAFVPASQVVSLDWPVPIIVNPSGPVFSIDVECVATGR